MSTARHLRIRVYPDGRVVVTAPRFTPQLLINNFVAENGEWISQKRSTVLAKLNELTDSRSTLFFRGHEFQFRLTVNTIAREKVERTKTELIVHARNEDHQTVRTVLEKWYRVEAKKHFEERLPLLSDLVAKDLKNVTIRSQRTRWGSCSSRSTISLNWRLIMAPDFVSDYVIYHELAHLTNMNHSKKFWRLVEDYCPRYKEAEKWLKAHHDLLNF